MRQKAAIVGFASSSRDQAPWADESFDIISLNHAHQWIPRWDVWYEMHPIPHIKGDIPREGVIFSGNDHYKWLAAQPGPGDEKFKPIYMQDHYPEIPASVMYPIATVDQWLSDKFGSEKGYYTSSISQMLALCMFQGYQEIHLYGIDLLNDDEYAYQRAGCEYLIGLARGSGIRVFVPKSSALLKANYVYGYSEPPDSERAGGRVEHAKSIVAQLEKDRMTVVPHFHTFDGSAQALQLARAAMLKSKTDTMTALAAAQDAALAELDTQIQTMLERRNVHAMNVKQVEGALNVAQSFVSWLSHEARGGTLASST